MAKKAAKKAAKKTTAKKTTAKKATAKKTTAKKATAKKATGTKKTASATTKKAAGAKKTGATKRKVNPAFMAPLTPSAQLAEIVGATPMSRPEVTSRIWKYIKKNNLQDAKNRRMINADDKLKPIFDNKKSVTMFDLTKHVNKHLTKI